MVRSEVPFFLLLLLSLSLFLSLTLEIWNEMKWVNERMRRFTARAPLYFKNYEMPPPFNPLPTALAAITSLVEPTWLSVAVKSPEWRTAMALEFDAL